MVVATPPAKKSLPAIAKTDDGLFNATGIEAFFAGKQTDSMGRTKEWTTDELDEIAESYNDSLHGGHEAPIVLGHSGSTAKGWIARAYRDGKVLKLDYQDVLPEFATGVNRREHPKRSISIYPRNHPNNPTPGKLNIKHIAYLPVAGEIQPAVKGLKDHKFNEQEDTYEYSELASFDFMGAMPFYGSGLQAIAQIFQSQRDQLIEDKGVEEADKVYSREVMAAIARDAATEYVSFEMFNRAMDGFQQQIGELRNIIYSLTNPDSSYSEFADMKNLKKMMKAKGVTAVKGISPVDLQKILNGDMEPTEEQLNAIASALGVKKSELMSTTNMSEITLDEFNELKTQFSTLQAESTAKDDRIAALEKANREQAEQMERNRVVAFCEKLVSDRKLLPTDKDATVQELLWLSNENPVEFSEGGKTITKTPRQAKMDRLAAGRELYSNKRLPTNPEDAPAGFSEQSQLSDDFDADSVVRDRQIRAKAAEMYGKSANTISSNEYAEAMSALGYDY